MAEQTKLEEKEFLIKSGDLMGQHLQISYKGKMLNTVQIAKLTIITDKIIKEKGESYDEFIGDYKK